MIVLFVVMVTTWYRTPPSAARHRVVSEDPPA
jgi:hypothetical protein